MSMSLVKHERSRYDLMSRSRDLFDRFFDDWPEIFRRPILLWPTERPTMNVEEFIEDGTLVVRAELPGIDPDKDVEIAIADDTLRIQAERREEEKTEGRDYVCRELRYGSFSRELPLPSGVSESDVKASYKNGVLEVRVPVPKEAARVEKKIPISKA